MAVTRSYTDVHVALINIFAAFSARNFCFDCGATGLLGLGVCHCIESAQEVLSKSMDAFIASYELLLLKRIESDEWVAMLVNTLSMVGKVYLPPGYVFKRVMQDDDYVELTVGLYLSDQEPVIYRGHTFTEAFRLAFETTHKAMAVVEDE